MNNEPVLDEVSDDGLAGLLRLDSKRLVVVYFYQGGMDSGHESSLSELSVKLGSRTVIVKMNISRNPATIRSHRPKASTVVILSDKGLEAKLVYDSPDRLERHLMSLKAKQ